VKQTLERYTVKGRVLNKAVREKRKTSTI